jgi:hypothetical protein
MYHFLRRKASEWGVSLAALIRDALREFLRTEPTWPKQPGDFTFVGSGRSRKSKLDPISERHDEVLAEDYAR